MVWAARNPKRTGATESGPVIALTVLKPYKSLPGYLHRFTLLKLGRLHIRVHSILVPDGTPFLHTHPFHYISLILSGGYAEKLKNQTCVHRRGSLIFRKAATAHQITAVQPNTKTLFITWETQQKKWTLEENDTEASQWIALDSGVYMRELYGELRYCKFDRFWHKAADSIEAALSETEPSIDQTTPAKENIALAPV